MESEEQKPTEEMQTKDPDVIKEEKDDIRKIIKFESTEETPTEENEEGKSTQKPQEPPKKDSDDRPDIDISGEIEEVAAKEGATTTTRESLEHKRELLQHIKDFKFQIKKNQEDITGLSEMIVGMTKDLGDLVSLYEIVSEQMNPFVGLSKVTKTRLDALENFIKEIDLLKERTAELESFAERSGAKLKGLGEQEVYAKTIDTDTILGRANTVDTNTLRKLSDGDLDKIIEKSLDVLSLDDRIDMDIDEFIESLKG